MVKVVKLGEIYKQIKESNIDKALVYIYTKYKVIKEYTIKGEIRFVVEGK